MVLFAGMSHVSVHITNEIMYSSQFYLNSLAVKYSGSQSRNPHAVVGGEFAVVRRLAQTICSAGECKEEALCIGPKAQFPTMANL